MSRSAFRVALGLVVVAGCIGGLPVVAFAQDGFPRPSSAEWALDSTHFNARALWRISEGAGQTVAVIDTGVSAAAVDLRGSVVPGADLTGGSADGRVDVSPDSHGTSIAGVIAAGGARGTSGAMVGLAPRAHILPIRVSTGEEPLDAVTLAEGIADAVALHATVINVSAGVSDDSPQLDAAVSLAIAKNIVVVASAGNVAQTGSAVQYPAALSGVVAVGGVDESGRFWQGSAAGEQVRLCAPAVEIYSTDNHGEYLSADGTSYAAAYVSATAALVRARFPHDTAQQAVARLIDTGDSVPGAPLVMRRATSLSPLKALQQHPRFEAPATSSSSAPAAHRRRSTGAASAGEGTKVLGAALGAGFLALVGIGTMSGYRRRRRQRS